MRILLDTSTLIWQLGLRESKLGDEAIATIRQADNVYVSSVSIVEMHIKTMLKKLDVPEDCERMILDAGNEILSFSARAGDAVRQLPALIRHDPFDRMLLAQAQAENLTFITSDTILLNLGLSYVVDARR